MVLVCLRYITYFAMNKVCMKGFFSERNLVVVLFAMVLISFALAQEDSKKMEKAYVGIHSFSAPKLAQLPESALITPQVSRELPE